VLTATAGLRFGGFDQYFERLVCPMIEKKGEIQ